tara:strand:+ start:2584 stop:2739 length:156 start_codon:yes stop_codon:yes gene_type:complete
MRNSIDWMDRHDATDVSNHRISVSVRLTTLANFGEIVAVVQVPSSVMEWVV